MTKELTPTELADVLESGKYAKTTGFLCVLDTPHNSGLDIGYCCLGVYGAETGVLITDTEDPRMQGDKGFVEDDNGYTNRVTLSTVPEWMQDEMGYDSDHRGSSVIDTLVSLNDGSETKHDFTAVIDFLRSL